jgi:uncharacterized protein with ATP-grasp and redox domains
VQDAEFREKIVLPDRRKTSINLSESLEADTRKRMVDFGMRSVSDAVEAALQEWIRSKPAIQSGTKDLVPLSKSMQQLAYIQENAGNRGIKDELQKLEMLIDAIYGVVTEALTDEQIEQIRRALRADKPKMGKKRVDVGSTGTHG